MLLIAHWCQHPTFQWQRQPFLKWLLQTAVWMAGAVLMAVGQQFRLEIGFISVPNQWRWGGRSLVPDSRWSPESPDPRFVSRVLATSHGPGPPLPPGHADTGSRNLRKLQCQYFTIESQGALNQSYLGLISLLTPFTWARFDIILIFICHVFCTALEDNDSEVGRLKI